MESQAEGVVGKCRNELGARAEGAVGKTVEINGEPGQGGVGMKGFGGKRSRYEWESRERFYTRVAVNYKK